MGYSGFLSAYRLTKSLPGDPPTLTGRAAPGGAPALGVYNDGTYTLLPRAEAAALTRLVGTVFPTAAGHVAVFAADWMGRLFATDATELDGAGRATVACFDLAEPSSFTTEASFADFHNVVAVEQMDALLNLNQYWEWVAGGSSPSDGVRCAGYKVPLFLGGPDSAANMELADRATYLHLLAELWQAKTAPR